jgi:hypothetical protein
LDRINRILRRQGGGPIFQIFPNDQIQKRKVDGINGISRKAF